MTIEDQAIEQKPIKLNLITEMLPPQTKAKKRTARIMRAGVLVNCKVVKGLDTIRRVGLKNFIFHQNLSTLIKLPNLMGTK